MKQINKTEFIRVEKTKNYTVIHNQFLRRKDLSWKAKGILAYVLSLPDDWTINLKELMQHATDGEGSFRSGWKELEEKGYARRYPVKDEQTKRIKNWQTTIYEVAQKPHSEKPYVEKPNVEKPHVENRNLLSTKETKYLKELSTNKDHSPAKAEPPIPYKKIIGYLNEKADRKFSHVAKSNKDLIKARWNGLKKLDSKANDNELYQAFVTVIDNKVADANDPNHLFKEEYLQPSTLFRESNFDKYLNQPSRQKLKENRAPNTDWDELELLVYGEGD